MLPVLGGNLHDDFDLPVQLFVNLRLCQSCRDVVIDYFDVISMRTFLVAEEAESAHKVGVTLVLAVVVVAIGLGLRETLLSLAFLHFLLHLREVFS